MNTPRILVSLSLGFVLGSFEMLPADVKMPAIFGDHMVLQQATKLPVWGTADAGEKVTVTVGSETGSATAGSDGKWTVTLAPLPAGTTPVTMTVAGKNTLTFHDVLVGDVWICSGQSNMEFGLGNAHNAKDEIPQANVPLLRLFLVPKKTSLHPETDIAAAPKGTLAAQWVLCTPDNIIKVGGWNGFSAVGYFFGREIQKTTGRPVGLIGTYWGGTAAQAWTSVEKLAGEPALKHYADLLAKTQGTYPQALLKFPAIQAAFEASLAKWKKDAGIAPDAPVTPADLAKAKAAGLPPAPKPPAPPDGGPNMPSTLYNGMIAPLIPYAIKGAIWYQGESNAGQPVEYKTLFADMITDWRQRWGEGDFPFLFVQLAKYREPNTGFAQLRESQLKTLALPNTGMAVAFDIGDQKDIHPKDKIDVGLRLALAAKHVAYGQTLVYSGPIFDKLQVDGSAARVSFTQIGGGLVIGTAPWTPAGATPLPNSNLAGFTIAGADKNWVPADARIDGDSVVVSSPQVAQPVAVRYAFPFAEGNLYNKDGLPASPFRTDDWEVTAPPKPPAPAPPPAAK
jgi:sialate O-acetylesterase